MKMEGGDKNYWKSRGLAFADVIISFCYHSSINTLLYM